ncbi:hypothetical protein QI30_16895 [Kurthia sp. 3B1D]|uniref:DUF3243 domain-containing protein n=1 Tax=Candidatus Kurthia intestinigallinarum TaxID=1562256 RepID=A0A433RPW9_9BACL|nr:DUF3243 family protein [Kurthia sp. 3B1D]RUS52442.1 hypothetical protein QI30_16895 [Kurthia sp. 3B1D]
MDENLNQVDKKLNNLTPEQKQKILDDFEDFKSYLGKQVLRGEKLGLSEETLAKGAKFVAEHLAKNEDPQNSEQNLLQELWKVTQSDEEKTTLSTLLVRLVQQ